MADPQGSAKSDLEVLSSHRVGSGRSRRILLIVLGLFECVTIMPAAPAIPLKDLSRCHLFDIGML